MGASFRNHLADYMRHPGYKSCLTKPDQWFEPMVQPEDKAKYCTYALLDVDDCMCICHDTEAEIYKINKFFKSKDGSITDPDIYLGAKVKTMEMPNGVRAWAMSPSEYIQEVVQHCEKYLQNKMQGMALLKRAPSLFKINSDPDLNMSKLLNPEWANYYQSQIRVLHWIVELGQIDITTEVSLLASHVALHVRVTFIWCIQRQNITHNLLLILHIHRLILVHSTKWIGQVFMVTSWKQSLTIHWNHVERRWSCACLWTQTMPMIRYTGG